LFGYGVIYWIPYPIRMQLGYYVMTFEEYPLSHYPNYFPGSVYFSHESAVIPSWNNW
jgi:hypothetical protein